MTKTVNAKAADPFAAIRKVFLDNIDALSAGHIRATKVAKAEFAKAKEVASAQAKEAQATVQANVDATVATGEIAAAGAEKTGALVQKEAARLFENNTAAFEEMINAKNPQDIFAIQKAHFDAEQVKAKTFFEAIAKLAQNVANDALKPVQAQVAENLKMLNVKAA